MNFARFAWDEMEREVEEKRRLEQAWLNGELESPIQRPEDEIDYVCPTCGELDVFCECQVPRLNEPPPSR